MATTTTTTVAGTIILAAALLLVAVLPGGAAQSPAAAPGGGGAAPGPSLDCFTYLANVSDCLTYVEAGSNLTKPEKGCCPELAALVENQPLCLCQLLGNSDSFGIKINLNKALKLPSVCGVNAPPVSLCSVAGYPVVGVPMPSASPFSPGGMSPEGLASKPASGNNGSGASGIAVSRLSLVVGLAIGLFFTTALF